MIRAAFVAAFVSAFVFTAPAAYAGNYGEHPTSPPPVNQVTVSPTATSASHSRSRSSSASTSSSVSAPVVNVTNQVTSPPGQAHHGSGGSHGGSSSGQVVPGGGGIMAAPIIEGGNSCAEGASAGANHWFTGAFFSWMGENHECSLRQTAAIFANMRLQKQAIETLCRTNTDVRWAMRNSGTPCQDDVERWTKSGWKGN